jgi:hypothetical protein
MKEECEEYNNGQCDNEYNITHKCLGEFCPISGGNGRK